jgi:bifunctional DNA-binding transcriptional regulator/antitoxin component of YhaV-PrlF toxin-antitoxin module
MNVTEIITERNKLKMEAAALQLKQNAINIKLSELNTLYNNTLINGFLDYIKVGEQFIPTKISFRPVRDLFVINPGDVFEIVKKNKKSVIIKYVKKFTLNADRSVRTETSPNTIHKIDLNKLFDIYKGDPEFIKRLTSSIDRIIKLEQLGI